MLLLAVCAVTAFAGLPSVADANWSRVSSVPSATQPYFACPPRHRMVRCESIVDPTPARAVRGPLKAGAITKGPSEEVSPALSGTGVDGGFSPDDLRSAYDLPSESSGSGQTVAVVDAFDDPNAESDLNTYRSEYGLPACTTGDGCFTKVNQEGETHYPSANTEWTGEISLDLDMVSAICPNCHLLLVEANSASTEDMVDAEGEAAALAPTEISNSFGERGSTTPDGSVFDHPGTPITFSGGDYGYGGNQFAADPHVIAVGGTTLEPAANSRGWTEKVWYHYSNSKKELRGTGSGCSGEPKPAWQTDTGCSMRTTNDVAAVADPDTPVSVYDSYKSGGPWRLVGGTSAASPIVAAAMALASPYTRSFEAAEPLYAEADEGETGFFDVLSGSNGTCGSYLCEAVAGYDGPTGLGALDGVPRVAEPPNLGPLVGGLQATMTSPSEATLEGMVSPLDRTVTNCYFEYGSSPALGSVAPCSSTPEVGPDPTPVSAAVSGLEAGRYYFRLVASNELTTSTGSVRSFPTRPPAYWYSPADWRILEGQPEKVKGKGIVTLHLADFTSIGCKFKAGGDVENPTGGTSGVDTLTTLALAGCKASVPLCAKREKLVVSPQGLPWQGELLAGPPVTDQLADTSIALDCTKEGHATVYDELTGLLTPEVDESVLQFGVGSGELEGHGAHPEDATITGAVTLAGPKKRAVTAKTD